MADDSIEAKALALVNEVSDQHNDAESIYEVHRSVDLRAALCRALEQHEAFKQDVSDAVGAYLNPNNRIYSHSLNRFIIPKPKPDPLVEIMRAAGWANTVITSCAPAFRTALDALGFEIREKGQ